MDFNNFKYDDKITDTSIIKFLRFVLASNPDNIELQNYVDKMVLYLNTSAEK